MQPQLLIHRHRSASYISVGGNIDAENAEAFAIALKHDVRVLANGDERIQLDLNELELDDGSAVAEAVNAIRDLLKLAPVLVSHAPQMLAHTLYKVGMLEGGRLTLHEPRADEAPYG